MIGQDLSELKRVDGKIIYDKCLVTFLAIKKMSDSIGKVYWKGIRLDCKLCAIFKNRSVYHFKEKK